jgi:site-specific DNA recombinase
MHSKAEKGWFPNIPPIGYLNSKTREKGAETILTDLERFLIVRKMWDLVLTGNYSLPKVLRIATEEWGLRTIPRKRLGGKSLSVSYMYKMFTNMFYAGSFMYGGKMYIGKHEAMITMDEFDQVQILLGKKGKPRSQKHDFPFTGIMYCGECGARITASKKQKLLVNGLYNTHTYYHCTGRKKYATCSQERLKLAELEQSVIEAKKLFIDLHGWFSVLKKGENELMPQIEALERDKTLTPERRKEAFASFRTTLCAGKDLNLRSPKATDLQSVVIDHSTTDAGPRHYSSRV